MRLPALCSSPVQRTEPADKGWCKWAKEEAQAQGCPRVTVVGGPVCLLSHPETPAHCIGVTLGAGAAEGRRPRGSLMGPGPKWGPLLALIIGPGTSILICLGWGMILWCP